MGLTVRDPVRRKALESVLQLIDDTVAKRIKWQFLPGSIHNMYRATDGDLAYTLQVKGTGDAGQTVLIKRSNSPADEEVWDVAAVSGLALIVESQVLYDSLSKGAVAVMPTTTPK